MFRITHFSRGWKPWQFSHVAGFSRASFLQAWRGYQATTAGSLIHEARSKLNHGRDSIYLYFHPENSFLELQIGPRDNSLARLTHSVVPQQEPHLLVLEYLFDTAAMLSLLPEYVSPQRILLMGLGGGSLVHYFLKYCPHAHIDVVELDEEIVKVAQKYCKLPASDPRISIHTEDAVAFVEELAKSGHSNIYDVIVQDAAHTVPSPLLTADMYQNCNTLLAPNGLYIQNMFFRKVAEQSMMPYQASSALANLVEVWPDLYYAISENNVVSCGVKEDKRLGAKKIKHPISEDQKIESAVWQLDKQQIWLEVISHIPNIQYLASEPSG